MVSKVLLLGRIGFWLNIYWKGNRHVGYMILGEDPG
jgi:hypothetical protein